jgi:hypothetical protein
MVVHVLSITLSDLNSTIFPSDTPYEKHDIPIIQLSVIVFRLLSVPLI